LGYSPGKEKSLPGRIVMPNLAPPNSRDFPAGLLV